MSPDEAVEMFQATIDWMKSVAKEEMKTVEGCRWLEQNWNIHVEYPDGTPDEQKFFKKGSVKS